MVEGKSSDSGEPTGCLGSLRLAGWVNGCECVIRGTGKPNVRNWAISDCPLLGESKVCPTSTVSCNYHAMARVFSSLAMRYVREARRSVVRLPCCGRKSRSNIGLPRCASVAPQAGYGRIDGAFAARSCCAAVASWSRSGRVAVASPRKLRQRVNMSTFVRHRRAVQ